jgi:phytoene synthase
MKPERAICRQVLAHHSKSFALAGTLFPPGPRDDAAAVYAWCRRADDAVDLAGPEHAGLALHRMRAELQPIFGGERLADPILAGFQEVVQQRQIPRCYADELLLGLQMDVEFQRFESMDALHLYCYRVAGTVGLMMCHVMGVSDPRALRHAAHLGMAMQLTNICRDVLEDWQRRHIYLPDELLGKAAAHELWERRGEPLPRARAEEVRDAVAQLLQQATALYRSGDAGMRWLSWRCALAVRTARLVYSAIGDVVAARGHDVWAGRAIVPQSRKFVVAGKAFLLGVAEVPARALCTSRHEVPGRALGFTESVSGYRVRV